MNGDYNVLDTDAAENGKRKEIWHGWGYARTHREEFAKNKSIILGSIEKQLSRFRIFTATPGNEPRTLERIEASIMKHLYCQLPPISEIPDTGMQLAGRRETEPIMIIKNKCGCLLHGLPEYLEA